MDSGRHPYRGWTPPGLHISGCLDSTDSGLAALDRGVGSLLGSFAHAVETRPKCHPLGRQILLHKYGCLPDGYRNGTMISHGMGSGASESAPGKGTTVRAELPFNPEKTK